MPCSKKKKSLAERMKKHPEIEKPYGLADWTLKHKKKRKGK